MGRYMKHGMGPKRKMLSVLTRVLNFAQDLADEDLRYREADLKIRKRMHRELNRLATLVGLFILKRN